MNCKQVKLRLSAYQDGELNNAERKNIQLHLQSCKACNNEYEELINLNNRLFNLQTHHLPLNFSAKIMSQVKEKELKKNKIFGFNLAYFVYSLLFIIFVTAGMYFVDVKTVKKANRTNENNSYILSLLNGEQELGLLDIQDNFVKLIESETK